MDDPNAARQEFAIFKGLRGLEIHLRRIGIRDLQLTAELSLISRRFTCMVAIGHNDVVDLAVGGV